MTALAPAGSAVRAPRFDRRVLMAVPEFDYGDPERGRSLDMEIWVPTMTDLVREVRHVPFDRSMREPLSMDGELLAAVEQLRPDLLMFSTYRDDVAPETLLRLKELTTTLAFFWDDHWRFDDFSSRYATLYDYCVTTNPDVAPRYRELGGSPIVTQYAGVPGDASDLGPVEDAAEFRYDVSFVGSHHPWRAWLVDWLGRNGVHVECFGAGWPNGRVSFSEMEEIFRTSRVNLNVSNSKQFDTRFLLADPHNYLSNRQSPKAFEQIKARHFEIPMAGGCELTFYIPGIEEYLRIGEEVAIYTSPEDCLQQIRRLLGDPARRQELAVRGWERCRADHTYERRVSAWLETVWPALN